jgi:phosphate transport system substrate-binding protein
MADDSPRRASVSRRRFLLASGAVGTAAIAGCTENNPTSDGGGSGGGNGSGSGGGSGANGSRSGSGSGRLSGTIDITGSSTVFPLATAMAERFMQDHPQVRIDLQSTGSGGGFENFFCPGETDFNNASRPIKAEEKASCRKNDVDPVELNVATDALTVIVNNDADWIDCVTTEELGRIWSAEDPPGTWSEVNPEWPDEPFTLYGPTEASGTYDYFKETIIGEDGPGLRGDYQASEQDRFLNPLDPLSYLEGAMPMTAAMIQLLTGDITGGGLAYRSLFAIGISLFAITLLMNVISDRIAARYREEYE